jgi:hypothetical protein
VEEEEEEEEGKVGRGGRGEEESGGQERVGGMWYLGGAEEWRPIQDTQINIAREGLTIPANEYAGT